MSIFGSSSAFQRPNTHNFSRYGGWYRTKRGHFVRSRAEREIADYFADHHEYYKYEQPLWLGGRKVKPDFYLPNRGRNGVYVEYQGMSGKSWGRRHYQWKQGLYDKHHVPVMNLYPSQYGRLGQTLMSKIRWFFS